MKLTADRWKAMLVYLTEELNYENLGKGIYPPAPFKGAWDGYRSDMLLVLRALDASEAARTALRDALLFAERYCPCGARIEFLHTHPHVPGCQIAAALAKDKEDSG